MDIQRIISLVKETKGIIINREMAAARERKKCGRLRDAGGRNRTEFPERRIIQTCPGYPISRRRDRLTADECGELLDS